MKKLLIFAIPFFVIFALFQNSYAKTYWRTFEVVEITSEGIVLQDFEGGRFLVNKDPGGYKVGDIVRYDTVKNRLKKSPWQPAEVIKMTDRTVTLLMNSGDKIDVNMRSSYRNEFAEGDQVKYNVSKGQIKKSNLQKLEE